MFLHSKNISLSQWSKCSWRKISILINPTLLSMNFPWNLAPAHQTQSARLKVPLIPGTACWTKLVQLGYSSVFLMWQFLQDTTLSSVEKGSLIALKFKKFQFKYFALNMYLFSSPQTTYLSKIKNVFLKIYQLWKSF